MVLQVVGQGSQRTEYLPSCVLDVEGVAATIDNALLVEHKAPHDDITSFVELLLCA